MKKMKKILGMLLVAACLLQSLAVSAEEAEIAEIKSYSKAEGVLAALEIIKGDENGNFNSDANITRGDFALIIARTLGLDSVNVSESGYSDVESGSEYASAVGILSQMKIFNGYENGRFYPDETLVYEQAIKIMVSALGYGYMAETKGGFPAGYLTYARQLKLTEDITATSGEAIVRGMAAQLIYNALDVKLMVESGYGDSYTYEKTGETLLTKYHDILEIEGTVTQTEYTGLSRVEGLAKNKLAIDDTVYDCNIPDAKNLLGHKVEAYATKYDNEILYICSDVPEENIFKIEAGDIDSETTAKQLVYEVDEKKEKLDISGASVIFNGRLAETYTDSDFKPTCGEIELIDADKNEIYEVVKITSYKNMLVSMGGMDNIYFKNGDETISIEEAKGIDSCIFETEEGVFDIKDYASACFPKDSVVSMAKSKDGQMIYMKVSVQKVSGRVKQVDEDGVIYIGEEPYKLNYECTELIANGTLELEIGKDYTFSVDAFGKFASFEKQSNLRYGYMMNCATDGGISPKLIVRMLIPGGSSGEIKNFYASDKVKINGVKYTGDLEDFSELYNGKKIKRQIIRYTINEKDEITSFETAVNRLEETDYIKKRSDYFSANDRFELDAEYPNYAYRGYNCETLEATEFKINGYCSHLFVAYDGDVDEKMYKAYTGPSTMYRADTYPGGTSFLYDVNENWAATAIVLQKGAGSAEEGGTSTIDMSDDIRFVSKVVACLNSDDQPTVGIDSGSSITPAKDADIKDEDGGWNSAYKGVYLKDVKPGSLVQYNTDAYGNISELRIVYMPGTETEWFEKSTGDGAIEDRAYATSIIGVGKAVMTTPSGYLIYNANSSWGDGLSHDGMWQDIADRNKEWDRNRTPLYTFLFDSEEKKFVEISTREIQPNDTVVTKLTYGHWLTYAIIYR